MGEVAEASESLPGGGLDERTLASLVRAWNERLTQMESLLQDGPLAPRDP